MFDLIREIGQTIRNNKLRTFLTGFAVTWGIFMLIVLLGMARGVTNSFEDRSSPERNRRINVYRGVTNKPYKGYKEGRQVNLKAEDIDLIVRNHPDIVKEVAAYKYLNTDNISSTKDYVSGSIEGVFPAEQGMYSIDMMYGRFINNADIEYQRKVLVLGKADAATLFGDASKAVGQYVKANNLSWLVVGVYDHRWLEDKYAPFSTVMTLSGSDGNISNLQVLLTEKGVSTLAASEEATEEVRATLAQAHEFDKTDQSALYLYNSFASYLREKDALGYLHIAILVIGILTLLSGIVGVSNIMFVSVRERTHEIGIRRAIGAKPHSILWQIVLESVAITTIFGYIGIFFGMLVMQVVDHFFGNSDVLHNPTVDISIAIEVTIVLIIAGALAGLFPALKATKVKPVEALRDE
ncbi:MAG: ABC transporter permease [Paramuribaculum sp.]|nr:ABC transporter permease [Paramuribaculum sp.]